jgi:hypothetical protein
MLARLISSLLERLFEVTPPYVVSEGVKLVREL